MRVLKTVGLILAGLVLFGIAMANLPDFSKRENDSFRSDVEATMPGVWDAAERGEASAQFQLGLYYHQQHLAERALGRRRLSGGPGMQAKQWLERASRQGSVPSLAYLAYYADSDEQRLNLIRRGAELGDATAQYMLGNAYRLGSRLTGDVRGDPAEAARWYEKAAMQGHSDAAFHLGRAYRDGWKGVDQSYENAAMLFLRAAGQEHPGAQSALARAYEFGRGVEASATEARQWHERVLSNSDASEDLRRSSQAWLDAHGQ